MSRLRRPRLTFISIGVVGAVLMAVVIAGVQVLFPAPIDTVGRIDFHSTLKIPPLAASHVNKDGTRVFDLTAQRGSTSLLPGNRTDTWGYDASYLGPTLRATDGESVKVNIVNDLPATTTLHWHGMHLPAAEDGGPHQPIAPGSSRQVSWQIRQQAATLWYHPHPDGSSENQVRDGLAGLFIIDDPIESALPLPRDYGVDDIPVMLQDASFDGSNQFASRNGGFSGNLGDHILVNGTLSPHINVSTDVVRLRLVNASTARVYNFTLSDGSAMYQIASDGGLLPESVATKSVQLSPGERAEVLVQVHPGRDVVLRSDQPVLGATSFIYGTNGGTDTFDILQLRPNSHLIHRGSIPTRLAPITRLLASDVSQVRHFELNNQTINGASMNMKRIDAVVRLGATEIWDVENKMASPHSFHVHDVQFQILDINGHTPPKVLAGWKDTVYLPPNTKFRLIMTFADYADPNAPYMFHCHFLAHEDSGMMGQFIVLAPGQKLPTRWIDPGSAGGMSGMNTGSGS